MIRPHLAWLVRTPCRWILKVLEIEAVSLALVMGMYQPAWSQTFTIKPSIRPDSLTVGDRFRYTNMIDLIPGYRVMPSLTGDSLGDAVALSRVFKLEKAPAGTEVYACTLAVYRPGPARIPTFTFLVTDSSGKTEQIAGDSLGITIHSVLPADTAGLEIADIRGPRRLRGPIWPYLLAPLVLAGLIFGGLKLRNIMRGKVEVPLVPPRPAWEVAIEQLDALKTERHIEYGRFKQFYFELSMIVRTYIEGRYETQAVESTTCELADDEKLKAIPSDIFRRLFEFFMRADLVKFAKSVPTSRDAGDDLVFAYDLVVKTRPLPAEAAEPVGKLEKVEA